MNGKQSSKVGQRSALWPGLPQEKHTTVFQSRQIGPGRDCRTGVKPPKVNFGATFPIPPIQSSQPVQAARPELPPLDAEAADLSQGGGLQFQGRSRRRRNARQQSAKKSFHLVRCRLWGGHCRHLQFIHSSIQILIAYAGKTVSGPGLLARRTSESA